MTTPTYNSDGEAVWKPQPGQVFPGGLRYVQSYGGIVSAVQDLQDNATTDPIRAYPNNFAGIISALEDLRELINIGNLPQASETPDGWEIIDNGDGTYSGAWQNPPADGTIWFDKRQGRQFVAVDGYFYQTNGGDGLAHVGPDAPINPPAIGSTWFDVDTSILYVYIGGGIWEAVVSNGEITVLSSTLGLSSTPTIDENYTLQTIPALPSSENLQVQQDFNDWLLSSLVKLDEEVNAGSVTISETEPTENLADGQLWFNNSTGTLSIYIGQWVTIVNALATGLNAPVSQFTLNQEISTLSGDITNLQSLITQIQNIDDAVVDSLETQVQDVHNLVMGMDIPDISDLATRAELTNLTQQVNALPTQSVDLTPYATTAALTQAETDLTALIDAKSDLELSDVTALIPDISNKVEQSDIDAAVNTVTQNFLPRTGGTIDGSFVINKTDPTTPTFDVSGHWWHSQDLFKLQSYSQANETSTFGATDQWYQYAWKYGSNEEYAWVHDTNDKVFSINKDGPACSQLFIGSFQPNTTDGRVMHGSTKEVGAELTRIDQELNGIDTNITSIGADITAINTDLNSRLRHFYGDNPPSGVIVDGETWFDSANLRFNVRHGGYWVYTDRVEDTNLKNDLYAAVNGSTDYNSLKTALLSALS